MGDPFWQLAHHRHGNTPAPRLAADTTSAAAAQQAKLMDVSATTPNAMCKTRNPETQGAQLQSTPEFKAAERLASPCLEPTGRSISLLNPGKHEANPPGQHSLTCMDLLSGR